MNKLLIKNARLVNENKISSVDVLVKNERIERIDSYISLKDSRVCEINAEGLMLAPGLIDAHVHFRQPGLTHKADISTESRAAAMGGITSFIDMPNTIPPTISSALFNEKCEMAKATSHINYSFYVLGTSENHDELMRLDPSLVPGVKIFFGNSTGNLANKDVDAIEKIFKEVPLIILTHCEDDEIIQENLRRYKKEFSGHPLPYNIHALIRDEAACYKATQAAVTLATKHNARLHVVHLSTEKELELFQKNADVESKTITAEVCLHHLFFNEEDYGALGNLIKWNPSIKASKNALALQQAVMEDRIDTLATDHAPHLLEEKKQNYFVAPSGAPLVQHAFPMLLSLHKEGKITLEKIVEKFTHNVAKRFKIRERGFVQEGFFADLCIFSLHEETVVAPHTIAYKCQWSPLAGYRLSGRVRYTIVNGRIVYDGQRLGRAAPMQLQFN